MARLENDTIMLTRDEFAPFVERVQQLAPACELARVLAEAQPMPGPMRESVTKRREPTEDELANQPTDEFRERLLADGALEIVGEVEYWYAITPPLQDLPIAARALDENGDRPAADAVAAFEPPAPPSAVPFIVGDTGPTLQG